MTANAIILAQASARSLEPSAFETQDLAACLLLLLLLKVVVLGGVFITMLRLLVRQRRRRSDDARKLSRLAPNEKALFAPPPRWLAIACDDSAMVQSALGLRDTKPCSWDDGVFSDEAGRLFLAPPVDGWTLVFGPGLAPLVDDPDRCFHFLRKASRHIGIVQFFSANPIVNHHCWALADDGDIFRAYAWAGETTWNQGVMTAAEKQLGMVCFEYGEGTTPDEDAEAEPALANAEKVHRLSGKWSVDPTAINPRLWERRAGVVGYV